MSFLAPGDLAQDVSDLSSTITITRKGWPVAVELVEIELLPEAVELVEIDLEPFANVVCSFCFFVFGSGKLRSLGLIGSGHALWFSA